MKPMSQWTIRALAGALDSGKTNSADIVGGAFGRAEDPSGEGRNIFRSLWPEGAKESARAYDTLRRSGIRPSPLAGLPISVKENLDIAGQQTTGACKLLDGVTPATKDAEVIRLLKQAGAVLVGRTNMSELAFSGVGYNRSFGTPANPYDRAVRRIPGGSSSGGTVSVSDKMAVAAIGTDTGGSVRIPAALCGIVGFKPTQPRVSRDGVLPLSSLLDCVGWMAPTVDDCEILDDVLASQDEAADLRPLSGLRVALAENYMLADCEPEILADFERARKTLRDCGATFAQLPPDIFSDVPNMNARGTLSSAEAWERFGALVRARPNDIDPRIAERIERGATMTAADFVGIMLAREALITRIDRHMTAFDLLMAPTVAITAPPIAAIEDVEEFRRVNGLLLRNPSLANLMNRPSISLPMSRPGAAPAGLMLIGHTMKDRDLLAWARQIEAKISDKA